MRAITYASFGDASVLELTDAPEPIVGPDCVLVEVRAVGLNPVDWKVRQGYLEGLIATDLPAIPAWDVAGVVTRLGADTPEFEIGDEVYAYARKDTVSAGTLAERVAVPLTGLTALRCVRRANVGPGDRVLIHGGAGGVGSFAIQLAKIAGAEVTATASARNHDYLRELGATPIQYGEGVAQRALEVQPAGYDVVLDFAGGGSLASTRELLRDGGRVVSIADGKAAKELGGSVVWVRPDAAGLAELADLIDAGTLRVEVAGTYPLAQTADAYRELETGHVRGKIVVVL